MAIVGFDTATEDTAVAVCDGDRPLHESLLGLSEDGDPQHSTVLLAEIERGVAAAGGWERIDSIAVGVGPGSFTGVRVGIATARALGLARALPVAGVCTLDALGRAIGAAPAGSPAPALALLDARRGEVFAALYEEGRRVWEPFVAPPEEVAARAARLPCAPRAAGSGAVRFRHELTKRGVDVPDDADPVHRVAARHICALAAGSDGGGSAGPAAPIYLRPPDAERWRERDTFETSA